MAPLQICGFQLVILYRLLFSFKAWSWCLLLPLQPWRTWNHLVFLEVFLTPLHQPIVVWYLIWLWHRTGLRLSQTSWVLNNSLRSTISFEVSHYFLWDSRPPTIIGVLVFISLVVHCCDIIYFECVFIVVDLDTYSVFPVLDFIFLVLNLEVFAKLLMRQLLLVQVLSCPLFLH